MVDFRVCGSRRAFDDCCGCRFFHMTVSDKLFFEDGFNLHIKLQASRLVLAF